MGRHLTIRPSQPNRKCGRDCDSEKRQSNIRGNVDQINTRKIRHPPAEAREVFKNHQRRFRYMVMHLNQSCPQAEIEKIYKIAKHHGSLRIPTQRPRSDRPSSYRSSVPKEKVSDLDSLL